MLTAFPIFYRTFCSGIDSALRWPTVEAQNRPLMRIDGLSSCTRRIPERFTIWAFHVSSRVQSGQLEIAGSRRIFLGLNIGVHREAAEHCELTCCVSPVPLMTDPAHPIVLAALALHETQDKRSNPNISTAGEHPANNSSALWSTLRRAFDGMVREVSILTYISPAHESILAGTTRPDRESRAWDGSRVFPSSRFRVLNVSPSM